MSKLTRIEALQAVYETVLDEYYLYEMIEKVADVLPVTGDGYIELIKARREKELSKEEIIKILKSNIDMDEYWANEDNHIGCYSYPNCEDAPLGCHQVMGEDAEPYGWRD
jgi:hypothetical protein|tara:strand:- start:413 stop:742 length:330 start_codon:yes stop_codon:yes gene_type:complete